MNTPLMKLSDRLSSSRVDQISFVCKSMTTTSSSNSPSLWSNPRSLSIAFNLLSCQRSKLMKTMLSSQTLWCQIRISSTFITTIRVAKKAMLPKTFSISSLNRQTTHQQIRQRPLQLNPKLKYHSSLQKISSNWMRHHLNFCKNLIRSKSSWEATRNLSSLFIRQTRHH